MATPTAFLSYNSTGINSFKTNWIRDLCKLTKTDFFSIQEHFRSTKNSDKYFKDQFQDYSSYVIPAVRNENQDSGRAKGGIAQFARKSAKIDIERIKTSNPRIQAQVLVFPTSRIIWINSYLPNDPRTIAFDDHEIHEGLNEVENILDSTQFDDCIWQGDLNWDMGRDTGFSRTMKQFLERLGLTSVWEHHPVTYTHIHTDMNATSTLDHFIVNERLLSVIADAGVLHLGDNLSRHSPILMKLDLGKIPAKKIVSNVTPKRPAWYKAEQEDKDSLQTLCVTSSPPCKFQLLSCVVTLIARMPLTLLRGTAWSLTSCQL